LGSFQSPSDNSFQSANAPFFGSPLNAVAPSKIKTKIFRDSMSAVANIG
jgi:hypothetical protein